MPVTIKAANVKYKSTGGQYVGVNSVSDNTTADQIAAINQAGATQTANVNSAGSTKVDAVNSAGATQVAAVNSAGSTQTGNVNAAGSTQVAAVQAKGEEVLESIPADYSELTEDVGVLKSAIDSAASEATGQEMLAELIAETGLTDTALAVIGLTFGALPSDETAGDIRDAVALEADRLSAIFDLWLAEKESA